MAYAIAQVRMKPVTREMPVETDIDAVERAIDGLGDGVTSRAGSRLL